MAYLPENVFSKPVKMPRPRKIHSEALRDVSIKSSEQDQPQVYEPLWDGTHLGNLDKEDIKCISTEHRFYELTFIFYPRKDKSVKEVIKISCFLKKVKDQSACIAG